MHLICVRDKENEEYGYLISGMKIRNGYHVLIKNHNDKWFLYIMIFANMHNLLLHITKIFDTMPEITEDCKYYLYVFDSKNIFSVKHAIDTFNL